MDYSVDESIIFDFGTAGFGGDDLPREVFPSVIGFPRSHDGEHASSHYVGDIAIAKRGILEMRFPIVNSEIDDWDGMELMWNYAFYEGLRVPPEEHPLFVTESDFCVPKCRKRVAEIMFERFNVPHLRIEKQSVAALHISGSPTLTGCIVDSGYSSVSVIPVVNGNVVEDARKRIFIGSQQLGYQLIRYLGNRGLHFLTPGVAAEVAQRMLSSGSVYVANHYETELQRPVEDVTSHFEVSDGVTTVPLQQERFLVPEAIFQPSLLGLEGQQGLHEAVYRSICSCHSDLHAELFQNIVLAGGNLQYPGMKARLERELRLLLHQGQQQRRANQHLSEENEHTPAAGAVHVQDGAENKYAAWIGASIASQMQDEASLRKWISKRTYEEWGVASLNTKER